MCLSISRKISAVIQHLLFPKSKAEGTLPRQSSYPKDFWKCTQVEREQYKEHIMPTIVRSFSLSAAAPFFTNFSSLKNVVIPHSSHFKICSGLYLSRFRTSFTVETIVWTLLVLKAFLCYKLLFSGIRVDKLSLKTIPSIVSGYLILSLWFRNFVHLLEPGIVIS